MVAFSAILFAAAASALPQYGYGYGPRPSIAGTVANTWGNLVSLFTIIQVKLAV